MTFFSLLSSLSECTSNTERFELLIEMASGIPPMPTHLKTANHKIIGCASNAWIAAEKNTDGTIRLWADGEAQIAKGFLAIMVEGLSGLRAEEILNISEESLAQTGLLSALSPSRASGVVNSFAKMKEVVAKLA